MDREPGITNDAEIQKNRQFYLWHTIVLELIFILTTNNFSNVLEALKGC